MINNFWSHSYIVNRLREKAEEHGIKVVEISEYKTSSTCPRCLSKNTATKGRLLKCLAAVLKRIETPQAC